MATRPRINPTAEQLQAAWQRRRRRNWPATYEAAMADTLLSRLVHMEAVLLVLAQDRLARRAQAAAQAAAQAEAPGPRPAARPLAASPRPITTPDRKRLAAGDTDDDL